jgi:hypothetical protein
METVIYPNTRNGVFTQDSPDTSQGLAISSTVTDGARSCPGRSTRRETPSPARSSKRLFPLIVQRAVLETWIKCLTLLVMFGDGARTDPASYWMRRH